LVLFLIPLQFVYLFCNLSECILLFFSCISSLLLLTLMWLMSYIYGAPILDVFRPHKTTQHSL
jgi:hypothetical protein